MSDLNQGVIERFCIRGLHGYKDVEIQFAGKTTIIVAENGTGKTTVLNALNAFLTRRFHRLGSINFSSIECKFSGQLLPIVLKKSHLGSGDEETINSLRSMTAATSLPESVVIDFIQNVYKPGEYIKFRTHPVVRQLYTSTHYDHEGLERALNEIYTGLDNSLSDVAKSVSSEVRAQMADVEIVYLPTYRRIERPLLRSSRPRAGGMRAADRWGGSDHDDMAFGLSDVQERLIQLSEDIERRSNMEYRALSARVLDEMLKGGGAPEHISTGELPDTDSLARFLSRVGYGPGSSSADNLFERIQHVYESGRIADSENWLLRYFLSRLAKVIEQTRETEYLIEQFVQVCNSYLTLSNDEKLISFDPQTLRVVVKNVWAKCDISLDDLSSGEKQIVSLMARLYLNSKRKVVLIDEPELSLSLDWQRKVLVDVSDSPTLVQMLAITHSPFVFDNRLDGCARVLRVSRSEAGNDAVA